VIYHSQPRFTKDMDLFIQADLANAEAIYAALAEFGAPLQGIRPEDFTDRNSFYRFGRDPRGFDILPSIPGVDFVAAWEKRVETVIDTGTGLKANFISAEELIASKLASGRARSGRCGGDPRGDQKHAARGRSSPDAEQSQQSEQFQSVEPAPNRQEAEWPIACGGRPRLD
jgi:hypothetical protein